MEVTNIHVPESRTEVPATMTQTETKVFTVSNSELAAAGIVLLVVLLFGFSLFSRRGERE
jgi:hypothetical protein